MPATTCFIIGPMGDAATVEHDRNTRLRRLARDIIRPLLDEERWNLRVETPFDIEQFGVIMDNVIAAIDHADLIIADLTGNNPNVFYELALAHALGIPTILIKEDDRQDVSFDVRALNYTPILIDNPDRSISRLRPVIRDIRQQIESWALFSNPVTKFYHAPITNISPAAGLAQGMYYNFVEPVARSLSELNPDGTEYLYRLVIDGEEIPKTREGRRGIKINIVIPSKLEYTLEDRIQQVKASIKQAEIQTKGRIRTVLSRWDDNQRCHQLYDIPTTMNTMIESINKRANQLQVQLESEEWQQLEEQEIGRFHLALKRWIDDNPSRNFKDRVNIIQLDIAGRDPSMKWLYDIWGL